MRRISKYIAGAMAVCMIATNLTTPVVYAMEQTVDITSSTVTESRIGTVPKQKNGTAQLCNNLHCPVFDDNLSRIAG